MSEDKAPEDKCPACPKCGSDHTRFTVVAYTGRFCYCDGCGNVWFHEEGRPPKPPLT
jgi:hypothetical protein